MTLKDLLPFEKYTLQSRLSVNDVLKRLENCVQEKQFLDFSIFNNNNTKPYAGRIVGTTFKLQRKINYRNAFLPVISGRITTFLGQTQITIKMRPRIFVLVFMTFWFGFLGIICLGILSRGGLQLSRVPQNDFSSILFFPFGMIAFGYLLIFFGFKAESKKSKEFLSNLVDN